MNVTVIGAGLAGCEAAWQLARRGLAVTLVEMKPKKMTPAHTSEDFAELVCSNSLRGAGLENAVGLLKEELRRLDSVILQAADATRVEAGGALAVDRKGFSSYVTRAVRSHPNITVVEKEVASLPEEGPVIVATGPLTSDELARHLHDRFGEGSALNFSDAAAHSERNKDLACHGFNDRNNDVALVAAGRDIQKRQLISALLVVAAGNFNWISSISQIDEINAFDHSTGSHVQTWDDAFGKHDFFSANFFRIGFGRQVREPFQNRSCPHKGCAQEWLP